MSLEDLGPRLHLFPRDPGKDAVQGPQKLSEELKQSEEFRGQFLRSKDCIFPRGPEEKRGILSLYHGYAGLALFPNRGDIEPQYSTFSEQGGYWKSVLPIFHVFRKQG